MIAERDHLRLDRLVHRRNVSGLASMRSTAISALEQGYPAPEPTAATLISTPAAINP